MSGQREVGNNMMGHPVYRTKEKFHRTHSVLRVINIAEGATVQLSCAEEGFEEFPEEYYLYAR